MDKKYQQKTEKNFLVPIIHKKHIQDRIKEKDNILVKNFSIKNEKLLSDINCIFKKSNNKLIFNILCFLEFKDIIKLKSASKNFRKLLSNKKILRGYALSGILSKENRLIFYKTFLNIKELKDNLLNQFASYDIKESIYQNILILAKDFISKDKKFLSIYQQINKDINRTFYTEKFKNGNGKEILNNILTTIAFIRPDIGYCQGMNFIVGALINFLDDEETCFWIFLHFIDNIELKSLYLQNMPDYLIKLYQLNYLIKENFPKMYNHLKTNRINMDIFFSKWILTIFSNFLSFDTLYNVWDVFLIDKWKAIFKFSLLISYYMKDELIKMDLHTFSSYVRNNNLNSIKFEELSKYYNKFKVTNSKLDELKEDFYLEQLKIKLEINNTEWEKDENYFINNYQAQLNNFVNNLKRPVELLQLQISKINLDCEKANKKYEKKLSIVNQLKSKIENEIESKIAYESTLNLLKAEVIPDENDNIFCSDKKNIQIKLDNSSKKQKMKKFMTENFAIKKTKSFKITNRNKKSYNDYDKIQKKLNFVNKELQKDNKALLIACEKMDKKQAILEKISYKRDELKKQLDIILSTSELTKRELIKNLSNNLNSFPSFNSKTCI